MPNRKRLWTDDEIDLIFELRGQHLTSAEIGEQLGRSKASIDGKFRELGKTKRSSSRKAEPRVEFQNQNLQQEADSLRQELEALRASGSAAGVESLIGPDIERDVAAEWKKAEEDSSQRIERNTASSRFKIKLDDSITAVSFLSDAHIAPGSLCDFKRLKADAELIRKTAGLRVILAGDLVDNHIKHRSAMIRSRSAPSDEYRLVDYLLKLIGAENILLCISGNHDAFTTQLAGVDMLQTIAEQNRVCYAPAEARLSIELPGFEYKIAVRHQYRYQSAFNQSHAVKRWFDMGTESFDVGVIAHNHECSISSFQRHGQTCWAARPGAYQIETGYSRQYGYNPSVPTCPTFFLFAEERRIIGHHDIRDAVLCWENLNR